MNKGCVFAGLPAGQGFPVPQPGLPPAGENQMITWPPGFANQVQHFHPGFHPEYTAHMARMMMYRPQFSGQYGAPMQHQWPQQQFPMQHPNSQPMANQSFVPQMYEQPSYNPAGDNNQNRSSPIIQEITEEDEKDPNQNPKPSPVPSGSQPVNPGDMNTIQMMDTAQNGPLLSTGAEASGFHIEQPRAIEGPTAVLDRAIEVPACSTVPDLPATNRDEERAPHPDGSKTVEAACNSTSKIRVIKMNEEVSQPRFELAKAVEAPPCDVRPEEPSSKSDQETLDPETARSEPTSPSASVPPGSPREASKRKGSSEDDRRNSTEGSSKRVRNDSDSDTDVSSAVPSPCQANVGNQEAVETDTSVGLVEKKNEPKEPSETDKTHQREEQSKIRHPVGENNLEEITSSASNLDISDKDTKPIAVDERNDTRVAKSEGQRTEMVFGNEASVQEHALKGADLFGKPEEATSRKTREETENRGIKAAFQHEIVGNDNHQGNEDAGTNVDQPNEDNARNIGQQRLQDTNGSKEHSLVRHTLSTTFRMCTMFSAERVVICFRPSATKSGRPHGVMYVSSSLWRTREGVRHGIVM